jgi:hypothetical protein
MGTPSMRDGYTDLRNLKWSPEEKAISRKAFDKAVGRECDAIMGKLKKMIATASQREDIWDIHDYLTRRRKEVDEKYDYRYSMLIFVFGRLIREGWLQEDDLQGLREEKLVPIRGLANL